jgi:hypothetical protein
MVDDDLVGSQSNAVQAQPRRVALDRVPRGAILATTADSRRSGVCDGKPRDSLCRAQRNEKRRSAKLTAFHF